MNSFLADMGITIKHLVAGFCGGVVSALLMRNVSTWQALSSVLIGTLTANFFTDHATRYLGIGDGAAGFLIGLTAMVICQKLIEATKRWSPAKGDGNAA